MDSSAIALIGGGRMGEAIIAGLIDSGLAGQGEGARSIIVSEPVAARRAELEQAHGVTTTAVNEEAVRNAGTILVCVKPQEVAAVLTDIDRFLTPENLIISIAAGITTSYIESRVPHGVRVLRAMPNTPALVRSGMTALCPGMHAAEEDMKQAEEILSKVGDVVRVKEREMDAVTALSGSGPAYVFLFIESLIDAGVDCGLSRDVATRLAVHTVVGSGKLIKRTGEHPAMLREMVTSPAGTTAAGVAELESGSLRATVLRAVRTARDRSIELGHVAD